MIEKDFYFLSVDCSMRHGAAVLWKNNNPIDVVVFKDDEQKYCYINIENFIVDIKFTVKSFKIMNPILVSEIYIEEPLKKGPNQITIVDLFFVLGGFAYLLYDTFEVIPKFLNQSMVKTNIVGSQKRNVDKKAMVEKEMLRRFPDIFEKLPDKKNKKEGDVYHRKYKGDISDTADALSVGLYGLENRKMESQRLFKE